MENSFKKEIERLRRKELILRFPDNDIEWIDRMWFGSHIKYTKGRKASGIEKNIIDFMKLSKHQAEKINTTGRRIDKKEVVTDVIGRKRTVGSVNWIPGTGTLGSADISATIYGLSVKIEVKKGKDRQSEHQKKYEAAIQKSGGIYFIAKDEDDFLCKYSALLEMPQMVLMRDFNS